MKCVIAFACLLAVASAGYINSGITTYTSGYATPLAYSTNYVAPVAYSPRSYGYQSSSVHPVGYAYGRYGYGYVNTPVALATEARQVDPVAVAAGAPLPTGDTVEVAAAKAAHFQAHAAAKGEHLLAKSAVPVTTYTHGVAPITTYTHGVAPAVTTYTHGVVPTVYSAAYSTPLVSEARQVDPVAIAAGAPLPTGDTVEVAAAKASHFAAHAKEKTGHFLAKSVAPITTYTHGVAPITTYTHGVAPAVTTYTHGVAPAVYSAYSTPLVSEARLVDPVAVAAGAPLPTGDTVEVAAAKAFHHAAHHEAKKTHLLAKTGHIIAKRSPVYVSAYSTPLAYSAPATFGYGYSTYAAPYAHSAYTGYGYGNYLGAYYG